MPNPKEKIIKRTFLNPFAVSPLIRKRIVRELLKGESVSQILGEYCEEQDVLIDAMLMEKYHIPFDQLYEIEMEYLIMLLEITSEKTKLEMQQH
jgi:hypothetical protein